MRIGIEAERANIEQPTGVEHYAKQMILCLAQLDRENEYLLYLRTKPAKWLLRLPDNFKIRLIPFPVFWTQLRISWEMFWYPVDALFVMASALPVIHPKNSIVTIHDLAWEFYPQTFTFFMRYYLKFFTWYACRFAKKVIAVSEQTKQDLLKKYNLPREKVSVIYHGFDFAQESVGQASENGAEKARIKTLPDNFILYLGTLQPRKNIIGLIEAYVLLKDSGKISSTLVIAGGKGWLYRQIMKKISSRKDIIYFGYVQDRFALLKKARLLVLPSFYEGFGMTILDAFAANVPVACSNISSLPEVAGDAAQYFDPKNLSSIAAALEQVVNDSALRSALVRRGANRLPFFTWRKTAEQTLALLTKKNDV